jgi:hypothetical protein
MLTTRSTCFAEANLAIPLTASDEADSVVLVNPNGTVTAVDLAKQLRWDPKKLRGWLRSAAAAGHPILGTHGHNDSWFFTPDEADQLHKEALQGSWTGNHNSRDMISAPSVVGASQLEMTANASAANVAGGLRTATPTSAGSLRGARVPPVPGLYAWWHAPGLLSGVTLHDSGPTLSSDGTLELAYVGIASSLHGRLSGDHLGHSTGKSTLRRALGAWLGAEQGWITQWRGARVQHDAVSERALTTWMEQQLHVTWVRHESPEDVEAAVIALLAPPLNHRLNHGHPNWPALDDARRAWRRRGMPASD